MKTVAELEADMHQNSPKVGASPSSTPQHGPTAACQGASPAAARSDDGDQTAFNKLLSLIKGGSNTASSVTVSPIFLHFISLNYIPNEPS